jgi:hypothetical protein
MFSVVYLRWGLQEAAQELEGAQKKLQGRRKPWKIARMAVAELGGHNLKGLVVGSPAGGPGLVSTG